MTATVDEMLADLRPGHSEFQLDHFVLAAHGVTLWGAYQQALREIRARDRANAADELTKWRVSSKHDRVHRRTLLKTDPHRDRGLIVLEECEQALEVLSDAAKDRNRELAHLEKRAAQLRAALLRDGPLTPERIARLDAEHWYAVVRRRCGFELLANGRIDSATLSLAAALPDDLRKRLGAALQGDARAALIAEAVEEPSPLAALPAAAEGASC